MKKKWIILAVCACLAVLFAVSPLAPYARSLVVMKVYSAVNERESLLQEKGIEIEIPGGGVTPESDWFPFVMTFNADGAFSAFSGEAGARLTILYNFPAFDMKKGCSRIYDDTSPYYNAFYGAYAVDGRYGFDENGEADTDKMSEVPEFDFRRLILEALGMPAKEGVFRWTATKCRKDVSLAGFDGWTRLDADLTTNGMLHERKEFRRNYLQFGSPKYASAGGDFVPVEMKGRVYARYFAEKDCTIFFYVMAAGSEVVESCDRDFLSAAKIEYYDS